MNVAYVDSSVIVALTFGEANAVALARRLSRFDRVFASNLLEAELRSACRREGRTVDPRYLAELDWVEHDRPLSPEIARVLEHGYVSGADCWHLATALYLAPVPGELVFLTLDQRQREIAAALGFAS